MSPQDKVERVLKEMHVMFSKSLEVGGMPDKMIIDRAEFMSLLDRLTQGIYELMEQYELTQQSRMAAERNFRRSADEIIEQANASAEDVYAASVLYTADAIGKIRALMDRTNDSMNELFIQFRRELRDQKDQLRANESELQAQLADLSDTRKYLSVLRDINREQERKNRDLEAEREIGNQYARNLFHATVSSADSDTGSGNGAGAGGPGNGAGAAPADQPDVTVNRDSAYFRWKAQQEAAGQGQTAGQGQPAGQGQAAGQRQAAGQGQPGRGTGADANRQTGSGTIQNRQTGPMRVTPVQREPEEKYPNEDAIYQQVLEDERRREAEENDSGQLNPGEVLKNIIFGRDQE